jgi:Putative zinc-finger domain
MAYRDGSRKDFRVEAVKALRELHDAGIRLDDVLNEREFAESRRLIHDLCREAGIVHPDNGANQRYGEQKDQSSHTRDRAFASVGASSSFSTNGQPIPSTEANDQSASAPQPFFPSNAGIVLRSISPKLSSKSTTPAPPSLLKQSAPAVSSKPSISREEYLAKLAAVRKKNLGATKSTNKVEPKMDLKNNTETISPASSKATFTSETVTIPTTASTETVSQSKPQTPQDAAETLPTPLIPKKGTIKKDLVKQKLEELKRSTAARQAQALLEAAASKASSRPSTPVASHTIRGSNHDEESQAGFQSWYEAPFQQTYTSQSFDAYLATMVQPPAAQTPVITRGNSGNHGDNSGRKRPTAADFMSEGMPFKRPLIRQHFSPELCVIDVSDSEESDDEMDLNDLAHPGRSFDDIAGFRSASNPQFPSGLSGFSPHRSFSGVQTPDHKAFERLKDIETQRRELEAKIAVMQQKKTRIVKGENAESIPPGLQRSISTPTVLFGSAIEGDSLAPSDETKDHRLQKKLQLDSQMASNKAKMEELRLQMKLLEEESERQLEEQNQLALELESAGVDTQGMSLTELKETQEKLQDLQTIQDQLLTSNSMDQDDIVPQSVEPGTIGDPSLSSNVSAVFKENSSESMELDEAQPQLDSLEFTDTRTPEYGEIHDPEALESGEVFSTPSDQLESGLHTSLSQPDLPNDPPIPITEHSAGLEQDSTESVSIGKPKRDLVEQPSEPQTDDDRRTESPEANLPHTQPVVQTVEDVALVEDALDDEQLQDDEMDMESSSDSSADEDQGNESDLAVHLEPTPAPAVDVPELRHYTAEDEHVRTDPALDRCSLNLQPLTKLDSKNKFTPYDSALKQFKAYRYHPQYLHSVSNGYNSLTYSNKIDPMRPLCQFELAGGACNDPDCRNQHFREMGLTGAYCF